MATPNIEEDTCAVCGKEAPKICSKCKRISYCGTACQVADKESHEASCELILDHVPWCDICNVSQDIQSLCFQCGFVFCGPCIDSEFTKSSFCPGCSRPLKQVCFANRGNIQCLQALMHKGMNWNRKRRSYWCLVLGQMHKEGDGGAAKDIAQAKYYFNFAGVLGFGAGYFLLGEIYMNEGDWLRGKEAFEKGAELQCLVSIYNLGLHYSSGSFDGNIDFCLAKKWLKKGARLNDILCCYQLGMMRYHGKGKSLNYEKAAGYFRRGADKEHVKSQHALGICYRDGRGVPQSFEMAWHWLEKAAAQGCEEATESLRLLTNDGH